MKKKKIVLGALALAVLLVGALLVRPLLADDYSGEPDPTDMMLTTGEEDDGFVDLDDGDVPLSGLPGEDDEDAALTTEELYVKQIIELLNKERTDAGLEPLVETPEMAATATLRAYEASISFSHTRPDGTSYKTALKDNGVTSTYRGENLAAGNRTPEQIVQAWMDSEGHRANMLNEKFTQVGAGYCMDSIGGRAYWSLLFAK